VAHFYIWAAAGWFVCGRGCRLSLQGVVWSGMLTFVPFSVEVDSEKLVVSVKLMKVEFLAYKIS
jgi:hypothetical protein